MQITMPSPAKMQWLIKGEGQIQTSPDFKKFIKRAVTINAEGGVKEGEKYALREEISRSPLLKEVAIALLHQDANVTVAPTTIVALANAGEAANVTPTVGTPANANEAANVAAAVVAEHVNATTPSNVDNSRQQVFDEYSFDSNSYGTVSEDDAFLAANPMALLDLQGALCTDIAKLLQTKSSSAMGVVVLALHNASERVWKLRGLFIECDMYFQSLMSYGMRNYSWATEMDTKYLSNKSLFNIATKLRLFGEAMVKKEGKIEQLIAKYVNFIDGENDVPVNIFQDQNASRVLLPSRPSSPEHQDNENVPASEKICRRFLKGTCTRGDDCKFLHKKAACKYYGTKRGCRYGNNCRFDHAKGEGEKRSRIEQEERLAKKRKADADTFYGSEIELPENVKPVSQDLEFDNLNLRDPRMAALNYKVERGPSNGSSFYELQKLTFSNNMDYQRLHMRQSYTHKLWEEIVRVCKRQEFGMRELSLILQGTRVPEFDGLKQFLPITGIDDALVFVEGGICGLLTLKGTEQLHFCILTIKLISSLLEWQALRANELVMFHFIRLLVVCLETLQCKHYEHESMCKLLREDLCNNYFPEHIGNCIKKLKRNIFAQSTFIIVGTENFEKFKRVLPVQPRPFEVAPTFAALLATVSFNHPKDVVDKVRVVKDSLLFATSVSRFNMLMAVNLYHFPHLFIIYRRNKTVTLKDYLMHVAPLKMFANLNSPYNFPLLDSLCPYDDSTMTDVAAHLTKCFKLQKGDIYFADMCLHNCAINMEALTSLYKMLQEMCNCESMDPENDVMQYISTIEFQQWKSEAVSMSAMQLHKHQAQLKEILCATLHKANLPGSIVTVQRKL